MLKKYFILLKGFILLFQKKVLLLIAINDVALNKDRKRPNYVPKRLKIAALVVKISPKKIGGDVVV